MGGADEAREDRAEVDPGRGRLEIPLLDFFREDAVVPSDSYPNLEAEPPQDAPRAEDRGGGFRPEAIPLSMLRWRPRVVIFRSSPPPPPATPPSPS